MGSTVAITDSDFDRTVAEHPLVVVDFYADWCGPCRLVSPILEQLAQEVPGLTVAKLDVDANPRNAMKFGVMSIPTLILFKQGKPVDMVVGAVPKAELTAWVQEHVTPA
ncbi:MAG: thioredoxin [Halobacteriales archaeon]|nr:thioredoxin [Halobacteriales archaeon]